MANKVICFSCRCNGITFRKKYDIIVSNPPFFENSLKSIDDLKNIAKHTTTLPYTGLATIAAAHLSSHGKFYIMLPVKEFETFEKRAIKTGLYPLERLLIRQNNKSDYFRTIGVFSRIISQTATEDDITIKDDNDAYSLPFIKLLKDYYLYL